MPDAGIALVKSLTTRARSFKPSYSTLPGQGHKQYIKRNRGVQRYSRKDTKKLKSSWLFESGLNESPLKLVPHS
jgi:hypothetical protein